MMKNPKAAMPNPTKRPVATRRAVSMNCLYAIRFPGPGGPWGFSKEQIENTLTAQSPALKSRPMTVRDILILPDKRLRQVSKPVAKVDVSVKKLVEDMFDTMYDAPGIGLAAIQIGEPKRVVTMDLAKKEGEKKPQVFINPEIVDESDEQSVHEEGCLSIPEYYEEVGRPASVTVKYLDLAGKEQEVNATGLLAVCLQHEIDHLNGVLFIDHLSKLKRDRVVKKFTKAAKQAAKDTGKESRKAAAK
jgi:peptide deformylase